MPHGTRRADCPVMRDVAPLVATITVSHHNRDERDSRPTSSSPSNGDNGPATLRKRVYNK